MARPDDEVFLELDDLKTWFFTDIGTVRSVDGVPTSSVPARRRASSASPAAASR